MGSQQNYYAVLGVSRTSDDVVIRAAFNALMLKYHPDTNKSADATTRAAAINEAFRVLGDAKRRAAYDASRAQKASTTPPPPPPPPPPPSSAPPAPASSPPMGAKEFEGSAAPPAKPGWLAKTCGAVTVVILVATLASIQGTIEDMMGLPSGSVRLVTPVGRRVRSDATVGTLREYWGE